MYYIFVCTIIYIYLTNNEMITLLRSLTTCSSWFWSENNRYKANIIPPVYCPSYQVSWSWSINHLLPFARHPHSHRLSLVTNESRGGWSHWDLPGAETGRGEGLLLALVLQGRVYYWIVTGKFSTTSWLRYGFGLFGFLSPRTTSQYAHKVLGLDIPPTSFLKRASSETFAHWTGFCRASTTIEEENVIEYLLYSTKRRDYI